MPSALDQLVQRLTFALNTLVQARGNPLSLSFFFSRSPGFLAWGLLVTPLDNPSSICLTCAAEERLATVPARIHGWPDRPSGRRLSPAGTYVSGVACSHPAPRSRQQYIMPLSACIGSQVCAACRIHLVKGCQTHGGRMMACGPAGPRVHADVSACLHARHATAMPGPGPRPARG